MKKLIIVFILFLVTVGISQYQLETVTISDTTTSALIDVPGRNLYLAGIVKPDSGGDVITFDIETSSSGTAQHDLLTQVADSAYTITLPDSTNAYAIPLPRDIFDSWQYYRIKFSEATTVVLTVIWRKK